TGQGFEYFDDGVLLVEHGRVKALGSVQQMVEQGVDLAQCQYFPDHLLMPGFIDSHIHYPQIDVIASYGEQLLDWLNDYTFPAELQCDNRTFAAQDADQFLKTLPENGTTSALLSTTVFAYSTE